MTTYELILDILKHAFISFCIGAVVGYVGMEILRRIFR